MGDLGLGIALIVLNAAFMWIALRELILKITEVERHRRAIHEALMLIKYGAWDEAMDVLRDSGCKVVEKCND